MASHLYKYEGERATIRWDRHRCIHAAECVHGLPGVFDQHRRPWIDPDGAPIEQVAEIVDRCPSGALRLEGLEGDLPERAPLDNTCRVMPDGPLHLSGNLQLDCGGEQIQETRLALCRCGHSKRKPLCDNSHRAVGFLDEGHLEEREPEEIGGGSLALRPLPDGPVLAKGPLTISDAEGREVARTERTALCRCGHSSNKPFCDGSHRDVGFQAD